VVRRFGATYSVHGVATGRRCSKFLKFASDLLGLYEAIWRQELRGARKPIDLSPSFAIDPLMYKTGESKKIAAGGNDQ
jgi:hypothetical protein